MAVSASMNSTNGGPKYAEKILVKNSKKQLEFATCWELLTLHLHCVYSYSHRIYIVRYQKYSACMCIQSDFWGVQLFVTPWTVACQTPLSIGFSRQEYWSGLPFPSPNSFIVILFKTWIVTLCYSCYSQPTIGSYPWDLPASSLPESGCVRVANLWQARSFADSAAWTKSLSWSPDKEDKAWVVGSPRPQIPGLFLQDPAGLLAGGRVEGVPVWLWQLWKCRQKAGSWPSAPPLSATHCLHLVWFSFPLPPFNKNTEF